MEILCSLDGESLSRFLDGELSPAEYLQVQAHASNCATCHIRLSQFRLADGLLSRAQDQKPRTVRMVASLSVAAALVASLATNVILNPGVRAQPAPPLRLSAAPSETLTSFYERVAR